MIHENEFFYENPDMYDAYLKLESFRNDHISQSIEEQSDKSIIVGKTNVLREQMHWNAQNNKEVFHKPRISVRPMII